MSTNQQEQYEQTLSVRRQRRLTPEQIDAEIRRQESIKHDLAYWQAEQEARERGDVITADALEARYLNSRLTQRRLMHTEKAKQQAEEAKQRAETERQRAEEEKQQTQQRLIQHYENNDQAKNKLGTTIPQLAKELGCPPDTLRYHVNQLYSEGKIEDRKYFGPADANTIRQKYLRDRRRKRQ